MGNKQPYGDPDPLGLRSIPWDRPVGPTQLDTSSGKPRFLDGHSNEVFFDNNAEDESMTGEIRVIDPDTGAEKGSKIERYDLIPVEPLRLLARHYGVGAKKYDPNNWRKSYDWSLSYAALQRHANAFWGGEDMDEETQSYHTIAIAWHAFCLTEFLLNNPEKDDRWSTSLESARM
jgi:hypothetical protein